MFSVLGFKILGLRVSRVGLGVEGLPESEVFGALQDFRLHRVRKDGFVWP